MYKRQVLGKVAKLRDAVVDKVAEVKHAVFEAKDEACLLYTSAR